MECIKSGTTTIACARGWEATKQAKIRGYLSYPLMKTEKLKDFYNNFQQNFNQIKITNTIHFPNNSEQIKVGLWVNSLRFLDKFLLDQVSIEFQKGLNFMIHISETEQQLKDTVEKFHSREIDLLDKYNLLSKNTNLIHCNHLNEEEIEKIKLNKCNITICPKSNINLHTGLPPVYKFLNLGINTSIGTDGIATNYTASLLETIQFTKEQFPKLNDKTLLRMITINPAKTLGFDNLGVIKEGFLADIIFFEKREDFTTNNLSSQKISRVMVNGEIIYKDSTFIYLNEKELKDKYKIIENKILL